MKRPKFQIGDEVRKVAERGGGQVFRIAAVYPREPLLKGEVRSYVLKPDDGLQRPSERELVAA